MSFLDSFLGRSSAVRVEPSIPRPVIEGSSNIPDVPRKSRRSQRRNFNPLSRTDADQMRRSAPLSADEIIDRNQRRLVAHSRAEAQTNDYMKNFLRLCSQNIIGSRGITLQARAMTSDGSLDRETNEAIETWWGQWSRPVNCDIKGRRSLRALLKLLVRTAAKDGEFFVREISGRGAGPMRYSLQSIDPQRCPVDYDVDRLSNGNVVRQGIEFNVFGRPVAYYFATASSSTSYYEHRGRMLERVPASEIIHGFLDEIEGQRRGLPWASTALWRLNMLDGFEKAALKSARTGASLGGFIEWDPDHGPELDEELEDEELYIEAEGGAFQELPPGAKVSQFNNAYPSGEFQPFLKAMLRGAGAGMGVAYVSLANDLEGVNFSSIRQGVLDEREHWMDLQEWVIETLLDRVFRSALRQALLLGLIRAGGTALSPARVADYENAFWQGRRWPWVDPLKDINAEIQAKDNLLRAPSDIIRRSGGDPESTWRAYAQDIQAMQDAGMPEQFIMAAVMGQASSPPATNQNEEPDDEGDDDEE